MTDIANPLLEGVSIFSDKCLTITAEDIAKGKKKSHEHCPLALAVKRQFPSLRRVKVFNDRIEYALKPRGKVLSLPVAADLGKTIAEFDKTGKFDTKKIYIGRTYGDMTPVKGTR